MMRVDRSYGFCGLGFMRYNGSDFWIFILTSIIIHSGNDEVLRNKNIKLFNEKHLFSLANDTGLSSFVYHYENLSNAMLV